jgi:signal peptidase I
MEIAAVPHRVQTRGERRLLVLGVLALLPVVLLVLLPAVLGLDRSVTTDDAMTGSLGRGSVVLARDVPAGDLAAGDVVTFTAPSGPEQGQRVTRRVVEVSHSTEHAAATTRGDRGAGVDPWTLQLDRGGYAKVWTSVPWVGYPFMADGGLLLLAAAAVAALALASYLTGRGHRAEAVRRAAVSRPARPRLPVAP